MDFLASFLTEIALLSYEFTIVQPSLIAASAVTLARIALGNFDGLPKIVRAVGLRGRPLPCCFGDDVLKCSELLLQIWRGYCKAHNTLDISLIFLPPLVRMSLIFEACFPFYEQTSLPTTPTAHNTLPLNVLGDGI